MTEEKKNKAKLENQKKEVKTGKKKNQKIVLSLLDANSIKTGMLVRVHEKIKEKNSKGEEKERIQIFEGMVIAHKHGREAGATITVRKESGGIGVEKIFPLHSPLIEKIELKSAIKNSKSKLYYLKNYKKRLKKVTF